MKNENNFVVTDIITLEQISRYHIKEPPENYQIIVLENCLNGKLFVVYAIKDVKIGDFIKIEEEASVLNLEVKQKLIYEIINKK